MASTVNPVGMPPGGALPAVQVAAPKPAPARPAPLRAPSGQSPDPAGQAAAVSQVNQHLEEAGTELKLQVDQGSGRTVFQVIQQGTGEVVLQVPSAEVLGMSRRVRELESQGRTSGALVDQEG